MHIDIQTARLAGEIVETFSWTDDELLLLIKTTQIMVAYFEARRPYWNLVLSPMRLELHQFEAFARARKLER